MFRGRMVFRKFGQENVSKKTCKQHPLFVVFCEISQTCFFFKYEAYNGKAKYEYVFDDYFDYKTYQ